ncbi:hypothetical protein SH601_03200 [Gracilibacillus sp. S3-1-1]|uniref:Uncharacterized protein n=1 Tax=Gracilibacillus pellucidus TaxID=3095368 RepID=A0ACC6M2M0_9BACI|nr:hypothetical protein [Gracilibacillus sp. S3-1-1]MDX8044982.1 hypothetical protein [Gracilibacillus sp. S3-1-1]
MSMFNTHQLLSSPYFVKRSVVPNTPIQYNANIKVDFKDVPEQPLVQKEASAKMSPITLMKETTRSDELREYFSFIDQINELSDEEKENLYLAIEESDQLLNFRNRSGSYYGILFLVVSKQNFNLILSQPS